MATLDRLRDIVKDSPALADGSGRAIRGQSADSRSANGEASAAPEAPPSWGRLTIPAPPSSSAAPSSNTPTASVIVVDREYRADMLHGRTADRRDRLDD